MLRRIARSRVGAILLPVAFFLWLVAFGITVGEFAYATWTMRCIDCGGQHGDGGRF